MADSRQQIVVGDQVVGEGGVVVVLAIAEHDRCLRLIVAGDTRDPMGAVRLAVSFRKQEAFFLGGLDAERQGQFPGAQVAGALGYVGVIEMGEAGFELAERLVGAIGRAGVDDDDLVVGVVLGQDGGEVRRQMLRLVSGADDDGDGGERLAGRAAGFPFAGSPIGAGVKDAVSQD